jgi:hypothetical protein
MTKKTKVEVAEKDLTTEGLVVGFGLRGIEFKNKDNFWNLKLAIVGDIAEYALAYEVVLDYNERGDLDAISDLENKIADLENENTLFGEEKQKMIDDLKDAIKEVKLTGEDTKKKLGEIKFSAITSSFTTETGVVVLKVEAEVVEKIIPKLPVLDKYKMTLKQIF